MISYIRGPLEEKREDSVVVEAGNIGYRIFIPSSVLGELPGLGEEVKALRTKSRQPAAGRTRAG